MPRFTFDIASGDFSHNAALFFANACDLAYSDDPGAAASEILGLDATTFRAPGDTQGFAGRGENFAVLAFRGSERPDQHPQDWLTDFDALQTVQDPFSGKVHAGFSRAITAAWNNVDAVLRPALAATAAVGADDPGLPLFVTGHSLGGALATLAVCRFASGELAAVAPNPAVRFQLRACYTFGAPRVGDAAFSQAFEKPPTYRLVNNLDIVPLVPLSGVEWARHRNRLPAVTPRWIKNLVDRAAGAPVYGDVGELIFIKRNGVMVEGGQRPDWITEYVSQSVLTLFQSVSAPVRDHLIGSYIAELSPDPV